MRVINRKAGMAGTNLGTAWIQIKPSMKGMTSSIRSELSGIGAKEGAAAGGQFSTAFAAKIGVISGITQQAFMAVSRTITSQLGDAVMRADTLERFPKVMEQMGYSAEIARNTIQKLVKGVEELPTPLNEVVTGTQQLVAVTRDVDKASDWALAVSDAMLSNSASAEKAQLATYQFLQVLQKGKPVGEDWRSIMEAAPGVMLELAEAMGYTSAVMGGDFYTAFQQGKISVNDVMDVLVKMDKEGINGMDSLHDRAVNASSGIETAMTLMKQSISNAMRDIILEIGSDNIKNVINGIKDALVGIVTTIGGVINFVQTNWASLEPIFTGVLSFLGAVLVYFTTIQAFAKLSALFNLIMTNPIILVIGAIVFAIAELIMHFDEIRATVEVVFGVIGEVIGNFATWVGETFQGIWGTITGIFGNIVNFFGGIWSAITQVFANIGLTIAEAVTGAFKGAVNALLSFIENFINTPVNILNGFIGVINDAFGWLGVNLEHIEGVHLPRLYTGGIVRGVGTDTSDSNLYALSKGEFVIRASAARDIGYNNLEKMNETGEISGGGQTNYFTINGYNKSPEELANIISRKIAFNQRGVIG